MHTGVLKAVCFCITRLLALHLLPYGDASTVNDPNMTLTKTTQVRPENAEHCRQSQCFCRNFVGCIYLEQNPMYSP